MRHKIFLSLCLVAGLTLSFHTHSQQRIAAAPANLQLTGTDAYGEEVTASSKNLVILYEQGLAKGELKMSSLSSPNTTIIDLLEKARELTLFFAVTIPEGKFAFGDSMNEKFTAYGEMRIGELISELEVVFDVSNIKDSQSNAFKVLGQGRLSLSGHFGLMDLPVVDSFTFFFNQNLTLFKP